LFGFKKRRAKRERQARQRAETLHRTLKTVESRPTSSPPGPRSGRSRRPEADGPSSLYDSGIYPHSSPAAMTVDSDDRPTRYSDSDPASSSRHDDSGSSGYTGGSWGSSDSSSSSGGWSDSGSGSSSSD
jgi:hypothetical protein